MNVSMTAVPSALKTQTLFDPESGMINPCFKTQLDLVGIVGQQVLSEYDPYHVLNVDRLLQTNGCFQTDCDFYKKGGISAFKITSEQAVKFLEDDFKDRKSTMPRVKKASDAVCVTGVKATMLSQFKAIAESLTKGSSYDTIHFIAKNQEDERAVLNWIDTTYKDIFKEIEVKIIIVDAEIDIFAKGLEKLSASIANEYVIITTPTFATKVELIAESVLKEKTCLGIASYATTDWEEDMELYGYTDVIARVCSLWNFKARQTHTEMAVYTSKHVK